MIAAALATATFALALALEPGGLEIAGDATCPTAAEIAARLAEIGPLPQTRGDRAITTAGARAVVTRVDGALRLTLVGAGGGELATRVLAADGSCADLATAAAVVVATWRADLDPDVTPSVSLPPSSAPAASITVSREPAVTRAPPLPSPNAHPRPYAVGLGLLASETGGDFAVGATVIGALGLGWRGLALDASVSATTSRSAAIGALPDAASWMRATLALGPAARMAGEKVRIDLHVQGLIAALHARGVGVPEARADTTAELGVGAGARVDIVGGTSIVWLGVDALAWPGAQRLLVANTGDVSTLPRLELVASVGIGMGRFP